MFHNITLVGRVGAAPETRVTKAGMKMSTFTVAVDIKGKDKKVTIWPKITAFGALTDIVEKYVPKGCTVLVEGRLSPDPTTGAPKVYTKKDGTSAASYDIIAEKIQVVAREKPDGGPVVGPDQDLDIPF